MAENDSPGGAEGSLITHLLELRDRLLYSVIAIGVVFGALLPFTSDVYTLVAKPLIGVLPVGAGMIATEVASPFLTPIKLTLAVAVVITIPFLLYQLWAFVAPGLYRHEQQLVMPLLVSSTLLFYGGMAFAYFVVFPMAFGFFVHALPPGVTMMTDIRSYLDFVFSMFFAFGISFEVPVAVVLLARMGVVDPYMLSQKRPYVILWAFIVAAVITPPDIFSQFFLAVPMILLFEVGLFFARRIKRAANAAENGGKDNLTDNEIEDEMKKLGAAFPKRTKRGRRKK
ncbi:MAG TPA: twin-arginine translocase subunit TatC [Sulfuricaulis sp.]|jgi:sec-independent protein translocase protein TatC|nr:twin-arginine translocase subunit TatC [Sulfuricaulis sp.]